MWLIILCPNFLVILERWHRNFSSHVSAYHDVLDSTIHFTEVSAQIQAIYSTTRKGAQISCWYWKKLLRFKTDYV